MFLLFVFLFYYREGFITECNEYYEDHVEPRYERGSWSQG